MSTVVKLEGRPLTREEERRIVAQTADRLPGSGSVGTTHRYTTLNPMAGFTVLLLLGMLGGSAAVFIAFFML